MTLLQENVRLCLWRSKVLDNLDPSNKESTIATRRELVLDQQEIDKRLHFMETLQSKSKLLQSIFRRLCSHKSVETSRNTRSNLDDYADLSSEMPPLDEE